MYHPTASKRRLSTLTAAVMFALGALLVSLAPGEASSGTSLSTGSGGASVGTPFNTAASVSLTGADELNAFDVTLSYNASIAVPTSVALNSAWTIALDTGTIGPGTIHVAASRLGFCTGTCPLFTVSWNAVGGGSFQVSADSYVLAGRQSGGLGNLTQTSLASGTITVTGGQPTPTNTPVPPTPTNTSVPPTSTSVPPTSTAVPTNTPAAPTASATSTVTAAPTQPASTPTPAAPAAEPTNTPITAAPTVPAVVTSPTPLASAPTASVPANPGPTSPVILAPSGDAPAAPAQGDQGSSGPQPGQIIPLPPRAGDSPAASDSSPLKALGILLMAGSGLVLVTGLAGGRRPRAVGPAVDRYLDGVESEARRK